MHRTTVARCCTPTYLEFHPSLLVSCAVWQGTRKVTDDSSQIIHAHRYEYVDVYMYEYKYSIFIYIHINLCMYMYIYVNIHVNLNMCVCLYA